MKAPVVVLKLLKVPFAGPVTMESGGEAGPSPVSVSLVATLPEIAASSFPLKASATGSGARSTEIDVYAVFEFNAPSLTTVVTSRVAVDGRLLVLSNCTSSKAAAY